MSALLLLADLCEAAFSPNREVDAAIWCAIHGHDFPKPPYTSMQLDQDDGVYRESVTANGLMRQCRIDQSDRYTASLDAAISLIPKGCWGDHGTTAQNTGHCELLGPVCASGAAATTPLAICAAALRARAALARANPGAMGVGR